MSKNEIIKVMFTNPLSKTGNLTVAYDQPTPIKNIADKKSKWGAALMAEKQTARVNKSNLLSVIQNILTRFLFHICHRDSIRYPMASILKFIKCALYVAFSELLLWKF